MQIKVSLLKYLLQIIVLHKSNCGFIYLEYNILEQPKKKINSTILNNDIALLFKTQSLDLRIIEIINL